MGREFLIDTRNEDDIIESRKEAKEHYEKTERWMPTITMSKAIDQCFKPGAVLITSFSGIK